MCTTDSRVQGCEEGSNMYLAPDLCHCTLDLGAPLLKMDEQSRESQDLSQMDRVSTQRNVVQVMKW